MRKLLFSAETHIFLINYFYNVLKDNEMPLTKCQANKKNNSVIVIIVIKTSMCQD